MKTKMLGTLITLLVSSCLTFAQDYAFKVLVNKGKNEVKSGNAWEPLKVGSSLKSVDELKVAENSYLGLIHVTGKPLELKDAGKYKVIDLSARVGSGASVLNKYADFIISNNTQKKNNLTATGAVHRGLDMIKVFLPPSSSYVFNDSVSIEWDKVKAPPYTVVFSSIFGDELHKIETSQNSVTINLNAGPFSRENDITVVVFSKKDKKESDPYTLRKFSKPDKERIKGLYREIESLTVAPTALNKLIQAGFYEQNKLLADAATAYQKAIKLEPNVMAYQENYEDFLLRNALKLPKEIKK